MALGHDTVWILIKRHKGNWIAVTDPKDARKTLKFLSLAAATTYQVNHKLVETAICEVPG